MSKKGKVREWINWFTLAVAVILVYKFLNDFASISQFLNNLIGILMPFIMGILIALILQTPCRKIEERYKKNKSKFLRIILFRSSNTVYNITLFLTDILFLK